VKPKPAPPAHPAPRSRCPLHGFHGPRAPSLPTRCRAAICCSGEAVSRGPLAGIASDPGMHPLVKAAAPKMPVARLSDGYEPTRRARPTFDARAQHANTAPRIPLTNCVLLGARPHVWALVFVVSNSERAIAEPGRLLITITPGHKRGTYLSAVERIIPRSGLH
jgi:hypothetical protein